MHRYRYKAAAFLLGISVIAAGFPASAAQKAELVKEVTGKGFYYAVWKVTGCELPGVPGSGQPKPEQPKPEIPDTEQPKPENPDSGQPKPEQPKPENPDTEQPKPEQPKPEIPDAEQPKPEIPDTEEPRPEPEQGGSSHQAYAMQVFHLVNQERAKAGLPALQYDTGAGQAALVRAKETEVSFSHTRPNGTSFSTALREQGVSFRGAGENIAWGQRSPEQVMQGWMNSSGHRANILSPNYTRMGVGAYQNSRGTYYWTQLFIS